MSSRPLALNSGPQPQPDARDRVIRSLEEEVRDLNEQLAEARRQLESQRSETTRAVNELRRQLSPLYQALRSVFGEIDAIVPEESQVASGSQSDPRKSAIWESWKQRLGGQKAKCIDAFLTHGALTQTQLRVVIGCATSTVPGLISDLRQLGLLDKNGSKYSLKEL